jgi:hypothetical protein
VIGVRRPGFLDFALISPGGIGALNDNFGILGLCDRRYLRRVVAALLCNLQTQPVRRNRGVSRPIKCMVHKASRNFRCGSDWDVRFGRAARQRELTFPAAIMFVRVGPQKLPSLQPGKFLSLGYSITSSASASSWVTPLPPCAVGQIFDSVSNPRSTILSVAARTVWRCVIASPVTSRHSMRICSMMSRSVALVERRAGFGEEEDHRIAVEGAQVMGFNSRKVDTKDHILEGQGNIY